MFEKWRMPISGQGKSGSTHILVAKKQHGAIIFLAGHGKVHFSDEEEEDAAKIIARALRRHCLNAHRNARSSDTEGNSSPQRKREMKKAAFLKKC